MLYVQASRGRELRAAGGGGSEPRHCGLRGLEQDRGPGHPPGGGAACQGAGGGLQCSGAATS